MNIYFFAYKLTVLYIKLYNRLIKNTEQSFTEEAL